MIFKKKDKESKPKKERRVPVMKVGTDKKTVIALWLVLLAGAFCVGFAGLDEYHQSFVAGRGPSVTDIGIDSIGVFFGVMAVQILCWIFLNPARTAKKQKKSVSKK